MAGWRDGGVEGQKDEGAEVWRSEGVKGQKGGGVEGLKGGEEDRWRCSPCCYWRTLQFEARLAQLL